MTTVVISQPFLFPWVGLFEQIRLADIYVHYSDVAFSKGSFVNRVQIKGPHGPEWMTAPLQSRRLGQTINELETDEKQGWRAQHLDRLARYYRSAPFCDEMLAIVGSIYERSFVRLSDLLESGVETVADYFGLSKGPQFRRSSELNVGGSSTQRVLAIVHKLGGSHYLTAHGGKNYLDHEAFEARGIGVEYIDYQRRPYPQQFGSFNPHVSILDLIANVGRAGVEFISSPAIGWREFLARERPQNTSIRVEQPHVRSDFQIPTTSAGKYSEDGGGRESAAGNPALD